MSFDAAGRSNARRVRQGEEYCSRWALRLRHLVVLSALVLVTLLTMVMKRSTDRVARHAAESLSALGSVAPTAGPGGIAYQ